MKNIRLYLDGQVNKRKHNHFKLILIAVLFAVTLTLPCYSTYFGIYEASYKNACLDESITLYNPSSYNRRGYTKGYYLGKGYGGTSYTSGTGGTYSYKKKGRK